MTTKERIHLLVDRLDEHQSETALILLNRLVSPSTAATNDDMPTREEVFVQETPQHHHLLTGDSPLWRIVGLDTNDGPDDVSENVDAYLAEAYGDLHAEDTNE